jgi:hypothetical protein
MRVRVCWLRSHVAAAGRRTQCGLVGQGHHELAHQRGHAPQLQHMQPNRADIGAEAQRANQALQEPKVDVLPVRYTVSALRVSRVGARRVPA